MRMLINILIFRAFLLWILLKYVVGLELGHPQDVKKINYHFLHQEGSIKDTGNFLFIINFKL